MNCLKYLIKNDLDQELDDLFLLSLAMFKQHDGKICDKCGIVQGSTNKGWKKFYCQHTEIEINKKIKEKEKKLTEKVFLFTTWQGC